MIILYVIFGFLSAVLSAMGMGGGTLLIPLLTIFLSVGQSLAQGYNLLVFLPISIITIFFHYKNNYIVLNKNVFLIIIFGSIFSVFGAYLAALFNQNLLKNIFGYFLIVLSLFEFVKILKK